jgi:PQQ-dependent dehydrogenase (methanol/ethanol family)
MKGVFVMSSIRLLGCGVALALVASLARAGWYTREQAQNGHLQYVPKCGVCHGADLKGGGAPELKGPGFAAKWNGKPLADLYNYTRQQMPKGNGDSLPPQDYADIVAFLLAQNGIPSGTIKFTSDSPMNRVVVLSDAPSAAATQSAPAEQVQLGALAGPVKQPSTSRPTQAELDRADDSTSDWLMYNKGYRGERYSRLSKLNAHTAARLKPVCISQLGELGTFQAGPVVYDGVLYATTHLGTYAIDATSCRKLWTHQHVALGPEMNATNKGVAIADGRVIRGTQDGAMYALDAKTGEVLWERQIADWSVGEGIGAAPLVWKGLIFTGKAGSDWGIKGAIMALKVEDGSVAWQFEVTPTGDETGADTWEKPGTALHGGGGVWVSFALDRSTGTLFTPVANPGPDYNNQVRPGANLFTNSVVALDALTGKLKWWYQLRPNDDHDWDTTVVSLFDSGGKKLVATAGKEGVLHVVNREDGKLVFKLPVTTQLNHDVPVTPEGVRVCPVAGVQWNGPAYSPMTRLLYVNAIDWCTVFKLGPPPTWVATVPYTGLSNGWGKNDPVDKWHGWINAVDPATGKMRWRVKSPTPMYAAVTSTGGNVLLTGDLDGNLLVLDARNGKELSRFNTGGPIAGGIVTYEKGGKQYVAVASGNSGGSIPLQGSATILIFGL